MKVNILWQPCANKPMLTFCQHRPVFLAITPIICNLMIYVQSSSNGVHWAFYINHTTTIFYMPWPWYFPNLKRAIAAMHRYCRKRAFINLLSFQVIRGSAEEFNIHILVRQQGWNITAKSKSSWSADLICLLGSWLYIGMYVRIK